MALHYAPGNPFDTFRNLEAVRGQIAGYKIDFFLKTEPFNQVNIIGVVVCQHGHRLAMFKTGGEQAIAVKRSHAFRANNAAQTTLAGPVKDGLEQSSGSFRVVFAVEKVEIGFSDTVVLIVWPIFDGGNAPNVASFVYSQEALNIRMLVERVFSRVELSIDIDIEWWHPLRAAFV
jgi:hypothetical protein